VAEQPSTHNNASAAYHKIKLIYRPAKKHYALGEAERTFLFCKCPLCLRYRRSRCDVRRYCARMAIASQDPGPGSSTSDEEASCGSFLGSAQCLAMALMGGFFASRLKRGSGYDLTSLVSLWPLRWVECSVRNGQVALRWG
jgi:hypothetical protein